MGNGRRSGLSKLPPQVKHNINPDLKQKIDALGVRSKTMGYTLDTNSIHTEDELNYMDRYFTTLENYQKSMEESDATIQAASGTVEVYSFSDPFVGGDADDKGGIRMARGMLDNTSFMDTTLPHEHTHVLMDTLITKELGFSRGSLDYNMVRRDASMYVSVNNAALANWKDYMKNEFYKNNPSAQASVDKVTTPYEAARFSGMRSYATTDYWWAPSGAGIEIPTVAAENLVKSGYNWNTLKQTSSYSYFVLKELKERLKK